MAGVRAPGMIASERVTVVLVGYGGSPQELRRAIESLRRQTLPVEQIICVDQSVDGRFEQLLQAADPAVDVLRLHENVGYPSACNIAAAHATGEYVLFLNPDATADPDCVDILAGALRAHPRAAIAGAQVLLPGDTTVNAGDNALHLSGLSWAGRFGQPVEHGPPRPATTVSGAALMVRLTTFRQLDGYTEGFFMYYDDTDLAWRARLAGWEVLFCPDALVTHAYEFEKGDYKWRYLERNRWWCLLTLLEGRTLLLLSPLLIAVEIAVGLRAVRDGWASAKADSWRMLWKDRRRLWSCRREIQRQRTSGDRPILQTMRAEVDSPFLSSPLLQRLAPALRLYRRVVVSLTR